MVLNYRAMRILTLVLLGLAVAGAVPATAQVKRAPRLAVWIELQANLPLLSSRNAIAAMLDRARAAGVTAIIPEAKNAWGLVGYESAFAPHIRTSTVARAQPPGYPAPATWFPRDHDLLQVLIDEAHARDIEVHVGVNVFSEGLNAQQVGVAFERPHWQVQYLTGDRIAPASEVGALTFVNPALPEVQQYELGVISEILQRYAVDGIVLDRIRYPDITADVSEFSRTQFEWWMGLQLERWPDDVIFVRDGRLLRGPYFRQWIAWRAAVIHEFIRAAERVVRTVKPEVAFAAYVGGWYPTYWSEGANWAASTFVPPYDWATVEWQQAAVAEFFDYLMIGLYYPSVAADEAQAFGLPPWMSVEGGAQLAREVLKGTTHPVGSLLLTHYQGNPLWFQAALQSTLELTAGAMLFDLVYLEQYDWWSYISLPIALRD